MDQIWITYTIISGLGSVAFNFINRKILKDDHDSTAYSWWFEFFRFIIFFPFVITSIDLILPIKNLLLFLLIGIGEFFTIYFYMKMHSHTELSVSSLIMQLRLILVPIIAFVALSEKLSPYSYLGILIILVGQIIALSKRNFKVDSFLSNAIKYSLIATFLVSLNNVLIKSASVVFNPQLISVAMALPSAIFFPVLMKDSKNRIRILGSSKGKKIFLAALVNAIAMIFLIFALKIGPVGKVIALHQSLLMLQVLIGILYFKEKEYFWRKIMGSLVVIIGVLLLVK